MTKGDKIVAGFCITIIIAFTVIAFIVVDVVFELGFHSISKNNIVTKEINELYEGEIIDRIESNKTGSGYDKKVVFPDGSETYIKVVKDGVNSISIEEVQ